MERPTALYSEPEQHWASAIRNGSDTEVENGRPLRLLRRANLGPATLVILFILFTLAGLFTAGYLFEIFGYLRELRPAVTKTIASFGSGAPFADDVGRARNFEPAGFSKREPTDSIPRAVISVPVEAETA